MNTMLSEFYGKFIHDIGTIVEEERPDPSKFEAVFAILADVKDWKPAKTVGKRTYDDKAFVASVKEQAAEGKRPLSARQLQFLVRMAVMYADQIPDCENRLKEAGLGAAKPAVERADPELVAICFEALDRIGGMERNFVLRGASAEENENGFHGIRPPNQNNAPGSDTEMVPEPGVSYLSIYQRMPCKFSAKFL